MTLSLALGALLLVIVLGVSVGTLAAVRGGFVGRVVEVLAVLVRGLPSFWLAMIAALIFGVNLAWVPVSGYVPFGDSPSEWARSLVLPVVVLGFGEAALVAIVTRAEMLAAMRSDYVRSLRANGYPWKRIVFKHIAKNAAGPVLTMVSLVFVGLLGGTILMEQIFAMPGLGTQMVSSTTKHDLPVIQGLAVFYTAMVVVVFLLTDIAHGLLNPKVSGAMSAVIDGASTDAELRAAAEREAGFVSRLVRQPLDRRFRRSCCSSSSSPPCSRPWLSPYGPLDQDLLDIYATPSADHLLGTDQLGRDILSRMLYGGRVTLLGVAAGRRGVHAASDMLLGLSAGTLGGWVELAVPCGCATSCSPCPAWCMLLVVLAIFGQNETAAMVTLGIIMSPTLIAGRLLRDHRRSGGALRSRRPGGRPDQRCKSCGGTSFRPSPAPR